MVSPEDFAGDVLRQLGIAAAPLSRSAHSVVEEMSALSQIAGSVLSHLSTASALSTNVRLLEGDKEVPRADWTYSRVGDGQVIHTELRCDFVDRAIADGQLLVIDSIDEVSGPLLHLREAFEYALSARAWINAYVTTGREANFGFHADDTDTIILQLLGRKQWRVESGPRGAGADEPMEICRVLEPGDVLAVPANTYHEVTGLGVLTVHLTLGFDHGAGLPARLRLLDHYAGRSTDELTGAELAQAKAMLPERRTGSSLPFLVTGSLNDCCLVRWASRLRPVIFEGDGNDVYILTMGMKTTIPRHLAPLVELLSNGRRYGPAELADRLGMERTALVKELSFLAGLGLVICSC